MSGFVKLPTATMVDSGAPLPPIVVKVGTSILRGDDQRGTDTVIAELARVLSHCCQQGHPVVLVSSGAVGLGSRRLGDTQRPRELQQQQVAAAVGQGLLMASYDKAFGAYGQLVAQVLMTRGDFVSRHRYRNATATLRGLLARRVLPIVNENDALATDELRCGDNDTLAARVAVAVAAERLILLTDVDRLYSADPRRDLQASPIHEVRSRAELLSLAQAAEPGGQWGTGGMTTKLAAARIATANGITVDLADGRTSAVLEGLLQGGSGGTRFQADALPIPLRKRWLAHGVLPQGSLHLDPGAAKAIEEQGASLLSAGITAVEGSFAPHEAVCLCGPDGEEIARGISRHSSEVVDRIRGLSRNQVTPLLGQPGAACVVHRDSLVLTRTPTPHSDALQ